MNRKIQLSQLANPGAPVVVPAWARKCFAQGMTVREAAAEMGLNYQTVWLWRATNGYATTARKHKWKHSSAAMVAALDASFTVCEAGGRLMNRPKAGHAMIFARAACDPTVSRAVRRLRKRQAEALQAAERAQAATAAAVITARGARLEEQAAMARWSRANWPAAQNLKWNDPARRDWLATSLGALSATQIAAVVGVAKSTIKEHAQKLFKPKGSPHK